MVALTPAYEGVGGGFLLVTVAQALKWCVVFLSYDHPVIGILAGTLLICIAIIVVVRMVGRDRPSKRVTGTAQVLSVDTMETTEGSDTSSTCRIALRVEIPGRAPYDATSSNGEFMSAAEIAAVQRGKTVTVQVDSTNPLDVWIDFSSIT